MQVFSTALRNAFKGIDKAQEERIKAWHEHKARMKADAQAEKARQEQEDKKKVEEILLSVVNGLQG